MKEYTVKRMNTITRKFETIINTDNYEVAKVYYLKYSTISYGVVQIVKTATNENMIAKTYYNKVYFKKA